MSLTAGVAAASPFVFPPAGQQLSNNPFAPGTFTGRIVICRRGSSPRVTTGYNALQGGAVGMLLYNHSLQGLATDNLFLPTVHLEVPEGDALLYGSLAR